MKNKGAADRLMELDGALPPEEVPPVAPDGSEAAPGQDGAPAPAPESGGDIPPEQVAEMLINYANETFKGQGITPLNPVQATLIRAGICGTAEKYGMTFDVVKYPELALIGGAVWIGFDKVKELKAKKAKEVAEKKAAEADKEKPAAAAA